MDYGLVACCCGLVERGGVGVSDGRGGAVGGFCRLRPASGFRSWMRCRDLPRGSPGYLDDVGRYGAVTHGIFGDEFKEGRRAEVVASFEEQVLVNEFRVSLQQRSKGSCIAAVDQ